MEKRRQTVPRGFEVPSLSRRELHEGKYDGLPRPSDPADMSDVSDPSDVSVSAPSDLSDGGFGDRFGDI